MALADRLHSSTMTASKGPDWRYWRGWSTIAKWTGFVLIGLIYFPLVCLALLSFSERPLWLIWRTSTGRPRRARIVGPGKSPL